MLQLENQCDASAQLGVALPFPVKVPAVLNCCHFCFLMEAHCAAVATGLVSYRADTLVLVN
jgi:hypothetical protein